MNTDLSSRSFCLYGTGKAARKLAETLRERGIEIKKFIDHLSLKETHIMGIPCVQPNELRGDDDHVILAFFNREAQVQSIALSLGQRKIYTLPEIYLKLSLAFESFWFSSVINSHQIKEGVDRLSKHITEKKSLELLDFLKNFRLTGDLKYYPKPQGFDDQYFPHDIPGWENSMITSFVDCGAYDGDTFLLAQKKLQLARYIGFEPDSMNYSQAKKRIGSHETHYQIFPFATWYKNETLFFSDDHQESSHVSTQGKPIQGVRLDDYLNQDYDLLKIDVEGADLQTLQGATNWIKKHRPKIAVSLYHRPTDLWEIPLFLAKLDLNYKFYLRQHGEQGMDTLLYALP